MCTCVGVCASVYVYIQTMAPYTSTWESECAPSLSDVGALGVIGGGDCWRVASSLFGVVETIVVLVGTR